MERLRRVSLLDDRAYLGWFVRNELLRKPQGLRLLKVSSDHQEAVMLADRLVRAVDSPVEGIESGQEGQFTWERRVRVMAVPDKLLPITGPSPQLLALSVAVRWDNGRMVEVATLRAVQGTAATP